ncbi:lipase family protein [Flavihumibacter stibioxidans]|uniref:Lipase n=1 Tax=Flavihumibacter stibioxidans TaxID=1834163 RepID=A0ABR7MA78_9BACT|nr:lipase family protein [Flavihumibacter stibioxidans]MBC6491944.1 lipase [Flavihumibacter stibioxidans]
MSGKLFFPIVFLSVIAMNCLAQPLSAGFDKAEYLELLKISARSTANKNYYDTLPEPQQYLMVYQSAVVGLDNMWDLWTNHRGRTVISIRGTTQNGESWLANLYAAMVPAKGSIRITNEYKFNYELAKDPKAAVHVGWLISTAFLVNDMLPKIDSSYRSGTKDFLVMGHSQGGAIAYLLTAHLYELQRKKVLPADMRFKTYCSAGPKPGNLYFAYEYEAMTMGGWAFNVVNSADWVPEVPMSIQTLHDFNSTNPFIQAKSQIKKQKFPRNLALKHVYNRLSKPVFRAQRNYRKYLGTMTSGIVQKYIPEFIPPAYYKSNHYVRTGTTIVLAADEEYYRRYPEGGSRIFIHHAHTPYMYLTQKLP